MRRRLEFVPYHNTLPYFSTSRKASRAKINKSPCFSFKRAVGPRARARARAGLAQESESEDLTCGPAAKPRSAGEVIKLFRPGPDSEHVYHVAGRVCSLPVRSRRSPRRRQQGFKFGYSVRPLRGHLTGSSICPLHTCAYY